MPQRGKAVVGRLIDDPGLQPGSFDHYDRRVVFDRAIILVR